MTPGPGRGLLLRRGVKLAHSFVQFGGGPQRHPTARYGAEWLRQLLLLDELVERRAAKAVAPKYLWHAEVERFHLFRRGWAWVRATLCCDVLRSATVLLIGH